MALTGWHSLVSNAQQSPTTVLLPMFPVLAFPVRCWMRPDNSSSLPSMNCRLSSASCANRDSLRALLQFFWVSKTFISRPVSVLDRPRNRCREPLCKRCAPTSELSGCALCGGFRPFLPYARFSPCQSFRLFSRAAVQIARSAAQAALRNGGRNPMADGFLQESSILLAA